MSPEFGRHKALLGRAAERTQMSGVGGFFHSASKGVGYDSGPRPDGTRANAAALIIQGLARGHAGRKATTVEVSANIFGTSKIIRTEITYVTSRI